jgi:Zn-dependent M16 (insulinase) family peptidase
LPEKYIARDWIVYCLKSLDSKVEDSFNLACRLITQADFSDLRRLRDLALELKNDSDSSLAPLGSNYSSSRSGKLYSRSRAVDEIWNGLDQLAFSHKIASMDIEELRDRMIHIRDSLVKGGVFINLTADGGANGVSAAVKAAEKFAFMGGPRDAKSECRKKESFFSLLQKKEEGAEVYASDSLQVGFAAMSLPCAPYGSPEQAAELVFSHELSYGALWEQIRMMGGAYGAHAYPDNLEGVFSFSTYRDPDPLRSLEAIPAILKKRGKTKIDQDSLEKVIIGTYSKEIRPRAPSEKGFSEFLRRLYGINHNHRLTRLKQIISLTAKDTGNVAERLAVASSAKTERCSPVIIAGKSIAEKAAKKLGVEPKELPV